jgi:hypothetical protein
LDSQGEILSIFGGIEAFGASGSFLPLQRINLLLPNLVTHRSKSIRIPKCSKKRKRELSFSIVISFNKSEPHSAQFRLPL